MTNINDTQSIQQSEISTENLNLARTEIENATQQLRGLFGAINTALTNEDRDKLQSLLLAFVPILHSRLDKAVFALGGTMQGNLR
jgi:hypothetical protein